MIDESPALDLPRPKVECVKTLPGFPLRDEGAMHLVLVTSNRDISIYHKRKKVWTSGGRYEGTVEEWYSGPTSSRSSDRGSPSAP